MAFTLPELPFAYDALEPFYNKETVEIHHGKHHQAYVNNANAALEGLSQFDGMSGEEILANLDKAPEEKRTAIRNNLGGHVNHAFFWNGLKQGTTLGGDLEAAIVRDFGSVEAFKEAFEKAAATRFGSGWAWLVVKDGKLSVTSTANQDLPEGTPLLTIDVWEHAYYLDYQNRRPEYITQYWNIVNWDKVAELFAAA